MKIPVGMPQTHAELNSARSHCHQLISKYATATAGGSLIPLPGVGVGADVAILLSLFPSINERFGLAYAQIESYDSDDKLMVRGVISAHGCGIVGQEVTKDSVFQILKQAGIQVTAKELLKFIPFLGQAIAAGISYGVMQQIGKSHLSNCYSIACGVIDEASRRKAQIPLLQNVVTVVGPTAAGKSSLCNALLGKQAFAVGVGHGTTTRLTQSEFYPDWLLEDTPGLLDDPAYWKAVMRAAIRSRVVAYVTTGQLYREEVEFVVELYNSLPRQRSIIVLLNMLDLRTRTMTTADQRQQFEALAAQLPFLPRSQICVGAAAPADCSPPNLDDFHNLLTAAVEYHHHSQTT